MKISTKLISIFLTITLVGAIVGVFSYMGSYKIVKSFSVITDEIEPKLTLLREIEGYYERMQAKAFTFFIIKTEQILAPAEKELNEFNVANRNLDDAITKLEEQREKKELVESIKKSKTILYDVTLDLISAKREGQKGKEVLNLIKKLEKAEENIDLIIHNEILEKIENLKKHRELTNKIVKNTTLLLLVVSISDFIMAIFLGFYIFRSVRNPSLKV